MAREDQLIERVRRRFKQSANYNDGLRVGIGDDAAVLRPATKAEWVVTTDAFLENVHFLRDVHPPKTVGYKALARATSDIAAMGARSRYFLLTLGLPDDCTKMWLDKFIDGMALAARRFGLTLVGGDTTKNPIVVISLTVIGEIDRGRAILRSGARSGDLLCVSGRLGEAALGLRLIQRKMLKHKRWAKLLKKHLYPQPRLALGSWLAGQGRATAMIDISDGLSTDLAHLCSASGVGATVQASKIPLVKIPPEFQKLGLDPLSLALNGGEDYELLFTAPKKIASRLPRRIGGVSVTIIGEITQQQQITLVDRGGRSVPIRPKGWDPFRKKS